MSWYTASLFFVSKHSDHDLEEELWEESFFLIQASTQQEAFEKAEAIGKEQECSYLVTVGDSAHWSFVKVERVVEVMQENLCDGAELFSRFLRSKEAISLLTPIEENE